MAELRVGVVRGFDRSLYRADVEILGCVSTQLSGVPVGWHVREDLVVDGVRCVVLLLDELSASGAVVVALFAGRPGEDPRFDPLIGHKHRGLVGDGPEVA